MSEMNLFFDETTGLSLDIKEEVLDVSINEAELTVYPEGLSFIHNGEDEIKAFVEKVSKPELNTFVLEEKKPELTAFTQEKLTALGTQYQTYNTQLNQQIDENKSEMEALYSATNTLKEEAALQKEKAFLWATKMDGEVEEGQGYSSKYYASLSDEKEDKSNKIALFHETPDDTHYPSEKLVYDALANKINLEASNLSDLGKKNLSEWSLPGDSFINVTPIASGGTYTAPKNGYFSFLATALDSTASMICFNDERRFYQSVFYCNGSSLFLGLTIPIRQGQTITFSFKSIENLNVSFIYTKGEELCL
ncbi:MAG: hypothetical protein PHI50_05580 [Alphaproteobacteria bacterium]|nr:hypothetical protein [Alphaproteobacteria bacterium]